MFESAILLGNGKGREYLDLSELHALATVSRTVVGGCNAIIDDHTPDVLAAVDPHMISEIRRRFIARPALRDQCHFWTCRRSPPDKQWVLDPDGNQMFPYRGYNSGHMLGLILAKYYASRIYMVGVDIWPWPDQGGPNNIYTNRKHYRRDFDPPVNHWTTDVQTWRSIFDRHPEVTWVWQKPFKSAEVPGAWETCANLIVEQREHPWTYV